MPTDIKIMTELLYKGALIFALMDAICIPLLVWRVKEETFRRMKWSIVIAAALVWFVIWSWAIDNFWEIVYSYVFPAWAQTRVPWIAFVVAGTVALLLWTWSLRFKGKPVLTYCSFAFLWFMRNFWAARRHIKALETFLTTIYGG